MTFLTTLLVVLQMLSAIAMIGLILVQHGKGADAGAAFGSGGAGSASLFGASGSANFLSRTTAVLATVFLVGTLLLASTGSKRPAATGSVLESTSTQPTGAVGNVVPSTAPADQIPAK